MSEQSNIINGICDVFITRGVGAMIHTPTALKAVAAFAAKDASVVVADVSGGNVCQAISDALEATDGRACLLMDLAERMADKFIVLTGVDPVNEVMLETIMIITAQADCPVVVALLPSPARSEVFAYADACAELYARSLRRRSKIGGAQ